MPGWFKDDASDEWSNTPEYEQDTSNRPVRSIWDHEDSPEDPPEDGDSDPYGEQEPVNKGWFGEDLSDARWGPQRRYIDDPYTGGPIAQHGFNSRRVPHGYSRTETPRAKLKKVARKHLQGSGKKRKGSWWSW